MTKTTTHNLSDELLMGYAAGALPQAFDLVVASHVSLSADSRTRLDGFEALGGALLNEVEGAEIADDSFATVVARINGDAPEATQQTVPSGHNGHSGPFLPRPLRDALGQDIDAIAWRPIGMGVKQAIVHDDHEGTARLLLIPAGVEMPKHSHRGLELTLVLQGAYSDEDGRYARGDIEEADEDTHHTPVAEAGEDCICLIATNARLKFDNLLPRIAQPFIGI
ncbi:MAG: ChrR family anti-sigma-E factor [Pseudomonadota bacterium]